MWQQSHLLGSVDWAGANSHCSDLIYPTGGYDDWRLPTKEEWEAFICKQYISPPVCNTRGPGQWNDGNPFDNVNNTSVYWSSTEYDSSTAWVVSMIFGDVGYYNKTNDYNVWPVRGGQ